MKKQVKQAVAVVTGAVILSTVLAPVAVAGDEEWATAGKILTGLAVFGVLSSAAHGNGYYEERTVYVDRPVYVERPVYYSPPPAYYYSPPPQVYAPAPPPPPVAYPAPSSYAPPVPVQEAPVVQPVYVEAPTIVYETRYFEGRRWERCPRVTYRSAQYAPREIVVPWGQGMRLYQPGIRGHITYVQQWSPHHRSWVSVGRHPCMW